MKIYFHSEGNFLAFSGRMGHKVYRGEKIQSQLTIQNIERLQKDVPNDADTRNESRMKSCEHHNFDNCLYTKLSEMMRNATEDNCTAPWMPNNTKICTGRNDINSTFMITRQRFTNQGYDCSPACRSTTVGIQGKNYRKYLTRKYGDLYVYYGFEVSSIRERHYFTFYRFMAEFGGYVGLFLGYSFFNFISTLHQFVEKKLVKLTF